MAKENTTVALWPGGAPGAVGKEDADLPQLTLYPPEDELRTGAAMIVLPGGGYGGLAAHEGEPIALWLNTLGIFAAVLRYRHAPRYKHPSPLNDAQRAIRTMRHRAGEWRIDPHRIGIMGSSAGGHLSATASTLFDSGDAKAEDLIDREPSNPNLTVLLYPVITMAGEMAHSGSRDNLLGKDPDPLLKERLSPERNIQAQTSPAFIFHTADDAVVPVHNAILYAEALWAKKIAAELHVFESGPHGVGLALDRPELHAWVGLCGTWLKKHDFARK